LISVVLLQNCMGCVEGETGSCSETYVMCAVDGTEEVSIKVEEEINVKDEIPEAITSLSVKTEHEVRLQGRVCGAGSSFLGHLLPQKRNSEITLNYMWK